MVLNCIILRWIEVLGMYWWYAALIFFILCYLYSNYVVIGKVHLRWQCYVLYLKLMWPCRRYFLYYDDHGLVVTTWGIMMICVVYLFEVWSYISICEVMWKYVFFLYMWGDYVDYDSVLICVFLYVDERFFLLDYIEFLWLCWWWYSYVYDEINMTSFIPNFLKVHMLYVIKSRMLWFVLLDLWPLFDTCINVMWIWYELTR